jgi:hypothetical protein
MGNGARVSRGRRSLTKGDCALSSLARALLAIVGAAEAPSGDGRKRVRELLATAQQYAVLEPRGKRIGAFIELVGADAEGIAIRRDGIFLWRRRVLPITMVAKVLPEQRAVVLKVDRRALERTNAGPTSDAGTSHSGDEDASADGAWQERIARYVSVSNGGGDDKDGKDGARPIEAKQLERPSTSAAEQPAAEPRRSDQQTDERHLLFVSTTRGYHLVERDGPPPAVFHDVTVPEHEGLFRVVKVAASPLPNDSRVCAYVQQTE